MGESATNIRMTWRLSVQVGDLVEYKELGFVAVVLCVPSKNSGFPDRVDVWTSEGEGIWSIEYCEVVNESR